MDVNEPNNLQDMTFEVFPEKAGYGERAMVDPTGAGLNEPTDGMYENPSYHVLMRLADARKLVTLYTHRGTWYTGWITAVTAVDVTMTVKTYVDRGMEIPYKGFPRHEIHSIIVVDVPAWARDLG